MSDSLVALHWFYVAVMFGSAIAFQILNKNPRGIPHYKYLIHTFVVSWSGLAYAALALGQGTTENDGVTVYYARYIDWVISTPLLLLSLNLTAKLTVKVEGTLTAALLGTQAIMIITGLVADLSPRPNQWFWYAAGCIALVIVLYLFWGPLLRKANTQHPSIVRVYKKSAAFLTIQWLLYPLVWAIGTPGIELIDSTTTTVLFIILPIVSKSGFGFFNLLMLRALPDEVKQEEQKRKAEEHRNER